MTLDELREQYIATNPAIRSKETARLMRISCGHFFEMLGDGCDASALTDRNLAAYMQWRREAGRRESTIERETAKLLTLARYAGTLGLVEMPRMRLLKAAVEPPLAFMRSEIRSLFKAARSYSGTIDGMDGAIYFSALLNVIWDCGERIGALLEVTRADVDLRNRWITIRVRKRNGATQIRQLRRETVRSLRRLLEQHDRPEVFAGLHRTTLYHHLNQILHAAGIRADRQHKFHCMRRSHASWLHRAGGDATASLGHSDPAITRKFYLDRRITDRWQAIDWLFSPLSWWDRLLSSIGW